MADEQWWTAWLATEQCPVEEDRGRLEAALRQRCRSEGIEPPTEGQIERVVGSALCGHETAFAAEIVGRLGPQGCARLRVLLTSEGLLAEVKSDPGPLGLETLLSEIGKLETVRGLGLPEDLFGEKSDRLVAAWRSRAARMFPSDYLVHRIDEQDHSGRTRPPTRSESETRRLVVTLRHIGVIGVAGLVTAHRYDI